MINPENGMLLCENCLTDCEQDEMIDLVLHWDSDTDYSQVSLCLPCGIKLAWQAKKIIAILGVRIA